MRESAKEGEPGLKALVVSYGAWFVAVALGIANLFALRRLIELGVALVLSRLADGSTKWYSPTVIVATIVLGLGLAVLLLLWEDRFRRAAEVGLRRLAYHFARVAAAELIVLTVALAVLWSLGLSA